MVHVFVVDDNASFREVFSRALDYQPGIEVVGQAGSLAEATSKLQGIDVVIVDRGLPDGDGLELIGELREASPGARVLVTSLTLEQRHLFTRVPGRLVFSEEVRLQDLHSRL